MSYYGTKVLARCGTLLVHLPQIRSAFGSHWLHYDDHGDGWQLLTLASPLNHQLPTVGAGPGELAAVTGTPVLTAWVSDDGDCYLLAAALPDGESWSAHIVAWGGDSCGYDHHRFTTLRLPADVDPPPLDLPALVANLRAWAQAADLPGDPADIEATLTDDECEWNLMERLTIALGLPAGHTVEPLFEHQEHDWWKAWDRGYWEAGLRVCRRWSSSLHNDRPDECDLPQPQDDDFIRFVEQVADSMYGGALTRQQLVDEAARLMAKWP